MKTFLYVAFIWTPWLLMGQAVPSNSAAVNLESLTNVFLTVDDFEEQRITGLKQAHINAKALAEALRSTESKAESEDPLGNWGAPSDGLRLSLRFDKAQYAPNEPITARILLRNVSRQELLYSWDGTDWSFPFTVIDSHNNKLQDIKPAEPNGLGRIRCPVYPSTQRRFVIRFDPHFKLDQPGDYFITVMTRVSGLNGSGVSELASAAAHIRIVAAKAESQ